jgi:hypothetical protein
MSMIFILIFIIILAIIIYFYSGGAPYESYEVSIKGINYKNIFEKIKNMMNSEELGDNGDAEVLIRNNRTLDLPIGILEKFGGFESLLKFSDKYTAVRIYRFSYNCKKSTTVAGNLAIMPFGQKIMITDPKNNTFQFDNPNFIIVPQEDTQYEIRSVGNVAGPTYILEAYEPVYNFGFYPYLCHFTKTSDKYVQMDNLMCGDIKLRLEGRKILMKMVNNNYLELYGDPFSYSTYNWVGAEKHRFAAFDNTAEEIVNSICSEARLISKYDYDLFVGGLIDICINVNPGRDYSGIIEKLRKCGRVRHFATITYEANKYPIFKTENFQTV